jgi:hypothetical protein
MGGMSSGTQSNYNEGREGRWDTYGNNFSRYNERTNSGDQNWQNRTEGQYMGGHRGKGPKNYQRSEERIREDVCDRLSDDDYLDASGIQVQVQAGEVILTGTVESRDQKRRAEDLVESISGVRNVENRIHVEHRDDYGMRKYTGTTDKMGGIGTESGTTNEVIRDAQKDQRR